MKTKFLAIVFILTLAMPACSMGASSTAAVFTTQPATRSLPAAEQAVSTIAPPRLADTPTSLLLAANSQIPTPAPTSSATPTSTALPNCPPPDGYAWSNIYTGASAYIFEIIPLAGGSYLLRGKTVDYQGTWLAKMDAKGSLLWQNIYGNESGNLSLAPNGNLVLEFSRTNLEIAPDGSVVRALAVPWYHPNADGSFTVISSSQVARYQDLHTPLWQVAIQDSGALAIPTGDGGAIMAYAGAYVDTSVYWAPIYTDIKVIKVDGNGQVRQKTYGTLVGEETLDFLQRTNDGGALLAGTHAYKENDENYDIWLMKLSPSGGLSWQTTLALSPLRETLESLYVLSNGYVALVSANYGEQLILAHLTSSGNLNWQKIISSTRGPVIITAIAATSDGGLLLAGETNEKTSVTWLARLDAKGSLLWEKTYGYSDMPGSPETDIDAILPLNQGEFLLAGNTDLAGTSIAPLTSAWLARVQDKGQAASLIVLQPGKFTSAFTIGSRPNTLPDAKLAEVDLPLVEKKFTPLKTNYQPVPACLGAGAQIPTPAALPSLTPSVTPTPALTRDLYLASPPLLGDDVLKLQQRLLDLGYREVGLVDGIFGKMTDAAVRAFQTRNGLAVDGYVGPKTWKRLFSAEAIPAA